MFLKLIDRLDALMEGTSFYEYIILIVVGTLLLLAGFYVAMVVGLSKYTTTAVTLPGFVIAYSGVGGFIGTLLRQLRR